MAVAEISQTIAAFAWMALAVAVLVNLRKWNKRFADLYDKLQDETQI